MFESLSKKVNVCLFEQDVCVCVCVRARAMCGYSQTTMPLVLAPNLSDSTVAGR